MPDNKKNIAILASGRGSNFSAIVQAVKNGYLKRVKIKLLLSDNKQALVRKKAKRENIKDIFLDPKCFHSRFDFDKKIVEILRQEKIDLILLAGYMRILSPYFVHSFKNRILNIHPAILPAFKGKDAIKRAFDYGCKVAGVTVHFVDEKVDHGPIILQESLKIKKGMTFKELEKNIHVLEHKLYPLAVKLLVNKQIKLLKHHAKII